MNPKSDDIVDLVYERLKDYKAKKIIIKKEDLKKFILSLFLENWMKIISRVTCYSKWYF